MPVCLCVRTSVLFASVHSLALYTTTPAHPHPHTQVWVCGHSKKHTGVGVWVLQKHTSLQGCTDTSAHPPQANFFLWSKTRSLWLQHLSLLKARRLAYLHGWHIKVCHEKVLKGQLGCLDCLRAVRDKEGIKCVFRVSFQKRQ
jgi:hypothetical protein